MFIKTSSVITLGITTLFSVNSFANQCSTVHFSDVGWTDITATTAITSQVLKGMGYQTETEMISVPVTYSSMANGDIDVFLGNWMPTMEGDIKKYREDGSVETVRANLTGAKYTLAVPKYAYDAGLKSFTDIEKYSDQLKERIYGIEPGNDGNRIIQSMIDSDAEGLADFKIVESSEAGMISQVTRAIQREQWMVFLAWAPHPMNSNFEIEYLDNGENYFGPDFGGASVYTNVRKGYLEECPNVGKLLKNLEFSLAMENEVMNAIMNDNQKPDEAALTWLAANTDTINSWLDGVTTLEGKPAANAVIEYVNAQ